jgi:hypothetical protein
MQTLPVTHSRIQDNNAIQTECRIANYGEAEEKDRKSLGAGAVVMFLALRAEMNHGLPLHESSGEGDACASPTGITSGCRNPRPGQRCHYRGSHKYDFTYVC